MAKRYDLLVRLLLIGDSGVGKTCMICRFADDTYEEEYMSTVGIDFKVKSVQFDGKRVRIQIWDSAGQERYETLTRQYFRRVQGIFLVYDITNEKSYQNTEKWYKYIREYAPEDVSVMLLGNKLDAQDKRTVEKARAQQLAKELKMPFYETSAKDSSNINSAFMEMVREVMVKHKKEFDTIVLEREDSDGGEYISELLREKEEKSCCVLT